MHKSLNTYVIKVLVVTLTISILTGCSMSKEYNYIYTNKEILSPFWKSEVMYNESVLMIKDGDSLPSGTLLFPAKKIISVRDSSLRKEYVQGEDYTYSDGVITLIDGAKVPYLTTRQLLGEGVPTNVVCMSSSKTETNRVLFTETPYIVEKQLAVTYVHDQSSNDIEFSEYSEELLPISIAQLKAKEKMKILVYGDSIATGCNSSKVLGVEPFTPTWPELVKIGLEEHYGATIALTNSAVGGTISDWGARNVSSLAAPHKPDLAIIAFGMNDGTGKVPAEDYKLNIKSIMDSIKEENPATEFVLISPIMANPDSDYAGTQDQYISVLKELENTGVAVVNMTEVHKEFLKTKHYTSMTGNNINHLNDFIARVYAMNILSLLVEYK